MQITGVGGCPYEDHEGEILNIDVIWMKVKSFMKVALYLSK